MSTRLRGFSILALLASLLGLVFAVYSTLDYADHLDRRVHDLHCSLVPGATPTADSEVCRAAMYSPYSALFKDALWGGVPISLFAIGAFAFFASFSVYLLVRGDKVPAYVRQLFFVLASTPALVSLLMLVLSLTKLGGLCTTCLGIYLSSALLFISGVVIATTRSFERGSPTTFGLLLRVVGGMGLLGAATIVPGLAYAAAAPDHTPYIKSCGTLKVPPEKQHELMSLRAKEPRREALFVEDPLCPTCRAFHARLIGEKIIDHLDAQVVLFPLDSECNWMLSEPLHPGACRLSRALLCAPDGRAALDWAFEEQEALAAAAQRGNKELDRLIGSRFGQSVLDCAGSKKAKAQLNAHLHFAAENNIPVSTPQLYLGTSRVCDEDTDIGLRFTLTRLAPELFR
jgi:uncharacterized membrane protein